jgi:hypothetical protein
MFNQYEELMLEIHPGGGASEFANLPLLMGQSDPRGHLFSPTSARQLRHIALLVISGFMR